MPTDLMAKTEAADAVDITDGLHPDRVFKVSIRRRSWTDPAFNGTSFSWRKLFITAIFQAAIFVALVKAAQFQRKVV